MTRTFYIAAFICILATVGALGEYENYDSSQNEIRRRNEQEVIARIWARESFEIQQACVEKGEVACGNQTYQQFLQEARKAAYGRYSWATSSDKNTQTGVLYGFFALISGLIAYMQMRRAPIATTSILVTPTIQNSPTTQRTAYHTVLNTADTPTSSDPTNTPTPDIFLTQRDLYKAYLGEKNQAYYLEKFEQFDNQTGGLHISWNWPAFFTANLWALYRKMYGWWRAYPVVALLNEGMISFHANGYSATRRPSFPAISA